jgi:mono/diheme cytochrome c family protein
VKSVLWFLPLMLCLSACDEDVFQRMRRQPKYLPYGQNTFFGDGRAMRTPPEGTVPREALDPKNAPQAWQEGNEYLTQVPVPVTRELLERGQKGFNIYCATCHGYLGNGASMVASKMGLRPPPSLHLHEDPPGFYYEVITLGRGLMASYANELSPEDRWAVVAYIGALKKSQATRLEELPPEQRRKLEELPR